MEVCVDNLASVAAAWEGGARRIELCSSLAEGGLTPTPGMAEAARALIEEKEKERAEGEDKVESPRMQIFALIRSRGGDFNYSRAEIKVCFEYIETLQVCTLVIGSLKSVRSMLCDHGLMLPALPR